LKGSSLKFPGKGKDTDIDAPRLALAAAGAILLCLMPTVASAQPLVDPAYWGIISGNQLIWIGDTGKFSPPGANSSSK
jgi:hypothetical protein